MFTYIYISAQGLARALQAERGQQGARPGRAFRQGQQRLLRNPLDVAHPRVVRDPTRRTARPSNTRKQTNKQGAVYFRLELEPAPGRKQTTRRGQPSAQPGVPAWAGARRIGRSTTSRSVTSCRSATAPSSWYVLAQHSASNQATMPYAAFVARDMGPAHQRHVGFSPCPMLHET